MKVIVNKTDDLAKEMAQITTLEMTDSVRLAVSLLENGEQMLLGYKNGEAHPCALSKIYYIEAVDEKCFAYTKDDCLEVKYKLYELEDILDYRFLRISKSMICNTRKISAVKSVENYRMRATLLNNESVIIARSYVKNLKKKLGL